MKYKFNIYEKIYAVLLVINAAVICFLGINYLTYGLLVYLVILRTSKKISNDNFLLLSLFIPNKYLQLFSIPIYIFLNPSVRKKRLRNTEKLFLAFILTIGIANCVIYGNMPLGTFFQVGVYYCIFKIIASFGQVMDHSKTLSILDKMLPVQLLACIIEFIKSKEFGDSINGTLISAHYLGVYLIIYIILLIRLRPYKFTSKEFIIWVIVAAFIIYVADAKHVWAIFVFAFAVAWLLGKLKIKNRISVPIVVMTIIVVVGTLFIVSQSALSIVSRSDMASTYILNENYNKKVLFFSRTFQEMLGLNGVFGFGVGQFGSQISITLSKGIIYDWDSTLTAYHYATEPYAKAVGGLMTEWYTNFGIGISSLVLGYPLVSFIGLFAELGIVGYLWLLRIFDKRFKNYNPTFIIAFFMLSIFDTYFEIPCVFVLILIATYANPSKRGLIMGNNRLQVIGCKERIEHKVSRSEEIESVERYPAGGVQL